MLLRCLERKPNKRTVRFAGSPISLRELHNTTGLTRSHLSYVLSNKKSPSLVAANKIAHALGISLTQFNALLGTVQTDNQVM